MRARARRTRARASPSSSPSSRRHRSIWSPGGPTQDVKIDVNNTQSFNQYLTSLTFDVDPAWSEDADGPGGNPPCTAADFSLVQPAVANVDLTPGNHNGLAYTGTIALLNTAANQDNCKSVAVDLRLHAN